MQGSLCQRFGKPPVALAPLNSGSARMFGKDVLKALRECGETGLADELESDQVFFGFLCAAFSLSGHLGHLALVNPRILARILSSPFADTLGETIASARNAWRDTESEAALMAALRRAKSAVALALGIADLGGYMKAPEITAALSLLADAALGAACDHLLLQQHLGGRIMLPDPEEPSTGSGLVVLGMGKYGAFELNYSSDIDIILFYDLGAGLELNTDDPSAMFVRMARNLNRMLQERTGEGYVFRVDLRLRPDPGSTPLAIPVETAFNYYEAYGQNWERAAFIKARAVAGDRPAGEHFLRELAPFIWRKHLDFAAIQDVHSIKRQIHAHRGHGEVAVRGHNVKLGRGGIREIEFFVQTQQLIAGGRRPGLRVTRTIEGLYALAEDGWINRAAAGALEEAYWYLRNVEHRIQMVADEQSHTLPEDDEGLERIALMMGHAGRQAFEDRLVEVMRSVESHYAALFEASPQLTGSGGNLVFTGDDDDPETLETLSRMGFRQPSQIIATIRGWHYGRFPAVRTAQARELLTELTPSLIEAFSESGQPDHAFFAFDRFLGGLPAGIQFFAILTSNPNLTRLLTRILGSAPRLTDIITRRPHVFDALIDPSFTGSLPPRAELEGRLRSALERATHYEARLDQARIFAAEHKFLIGIRFINRSINARQAGAAFTELAEILLQAMVDVVTSEFELRHGRIAGGRIAVLGMGRLGAGELTAGSDLDLIYLYDHDEDADASDGQKPLYPAQYFMRLVQRLIAAMSAPTAEGVIYELDFRLRPSGNAGPLATHLSSFVRYQMEEAWTWELQALTRARVVAGDREFAGEVSAKVREILRVPRDMKKIGRDITEMRKTLDAEKPASNVFDVKKAQGGLVDIEFLAQWGALGWPGSGEGGRDRSTPSMIARLPEEAIAGEDRQTLINAYDLYNGVFQTLRLCLSSDFDPAQADRGISEILAMQAGSPDLSALANDLAETQRTVRSVFSAVMKKSG